MHFFSSKKLTTFLVVAVKTQAANAADCFTVTETNKAVRYGNIFIFCSHYYRSKANRQGGAREVDLSARSFDLARPGVAPPLHNSTVIVDFVELLSVLCCTCIMVF